LSELISQSEADLAYIRLKEVLEKNALFRYSDPKLSEADTRAKLIDPLFREVLGWTEADIRREKPANSGFADYVFGLDAAFLLVEAKRTNPRFHLDAPTRPRKLRLDGPHLLGQKKVKPSVEQVQGYASSLGAQFAVLTNGSQFVIFKPYLPGRSWTTGTAVVFHDHDDIIQDFALFHRLSQENGSMPVHSWKSSNRLKVSQLLFSHRFNFLMTPTVNWYAIRSGLKSQEYSARCLQTI
jgi:hypothetical protein